MEPGRMRITLCLVQAPACIIFVARSVYHFDSNKFISRQKNNLKIVKNEKEKCFGSAQKLRSVG